MTNKEAIERLKWVQKRICDITYSPESFEAINIAIEKLREERPQGEWIKNKGRDLRDNFYTCSICGRTINVICGETLANYPYCHCGADMRGGAE